jgi:hypothetical protein
MSARLILLRGLRRSRCGNLSPLKLCGAFRIAEITATLRGFFRRERLRADATL